MSTRTTFRRPDVFLRLGLRSNPFNHRSHDELVTLFGVQQHVDAWLADDWRVLVLAGESGCGKTTAAHMLRARAQSSGMAVSYHRLEPAKPRFPRRPPHIDLFVVDSIQRIPPKKRARIVRKLATEERTVLLGQEDITQGLDVSGLRRVMVPVLTADEARAQYDAYMSRAILPGQHGPQAPNAEVFEALLEASRGNRFRLSRLLYHGFELLALGHGGPLDETWAAAAADRFAAEATDVVEDER